jgi:hypothetical protein
VRGRAGQGERGAGRRGGELQEEAAVPLFAAEELLLNPTLLVG